MSLYRKIVNEHVDLCKSLYEIEDEFQTASDIITQTLVDGNKIILCGNGGSAADCQHIAAEFVGRFRKERRSLSAIALTVDTSAITAIANDYGYEKVFARQIAGLGVEGDCLLAISTSGNSPSILEAALQAREQKITSIGLLGGGGGAMKDVCDISIIVPSNITARIQEMHILLGHLFCEQVDNRFG